MGNSHNAASAHYGNLSGGNPQMAGIVGHSSSPVGNSLFGYAHGVNLNNLVKLSDHKVMNYNFNYSHNLSHGNSFSQTTYIQPDNSELLLTENIADRIHSNSANLQLIYENNAKSLFLKNALSLYSQWNEGRATVSSGLQGENVVTQASHYRSLGLANKTRMVRRTAKGGGFEWTSTNRVSSAPQALAIGGHRQQFQHPAQSSSTQMVIIRIGTSECHLYGIAVHPCPPRRSYGSPWRYELYECRCGCRSCGTICQWCVPDIAQCTGSRGLHIAPQCLGCGRGDRCRPCEAACATVILLVVESQQQFHVKSQCPLFHL